MDDALEAARRRSTTGPGTREPVPHIAPKAPRRAITSVDLGELKSQVEQQSIAAGQTTSTWLRGLIQRELTVNGDSSDGASPPAAMTQRSLASSTRRSAPYRAWLEGDLVVKVDRLCEAGGFRTRAAALRALLDGVNLGSGPGASLSDAVTALGTSNYHLVAIGRNLNQIAKSLNAYPGKTTVADRLALQRAERDLRQHVEEAAKLVGQLRPLLKSPKKRA